MTTTVSSGTISGFVVSAGGELAVLSAGVAVATSVLSGGSDLVFSGGVVRSGTVAAGGTEVVGAGGTADRTAAGGEQEVLSGGLANRSLVSSGGTLLVSAGGEADAVTVRNGGALVDGGIVRVSGGRITGAEVAQGGELFVSSGAALRATSVAGFVSLLSGAAASGTVTLSGGTEQVLGGIASGSVVSAGGTEYVLQGGTAAGTLDDGLQVVGAARYGTAAALDTRIGDGGLETVFSGSTTTGTVLLSAGTATLLAGAVASGTTVSSGGTLRISAGGTATDLGVRKGGTVLDAGSAVLVAGDKAVSIAVLTGGTLDILSGGVASGAAIGSGGLATVSAGGSADGTTVGDGGVLAVTDGGAIAGTTHLQSSGTLDFILGGTLDETGAIAGAGQVVVSGGTLVLDGADTYAGGTVIAAGTLELAASGAGGSGDIVFGGAGTTLAIDGTAGPSNTISGFAAGDTIELRGLTYADDGTITVTNSGSTVTVEATSGGVTTDEVLTIAGARMLRPFELSQAADGGTDLTPACYAPGTRIATPGGERPIEALAIGDAVLTASGETRPVRWIGRRAYAAPFAARNPALWPVTVRAGALADGVPARDLRLSPNHALLLLGVLVEVRLLVNGASIVQPVPEGAVEYVNLEFDDHQAILAEGAAAESFLACEGRGMFANAAEYARLYPDATAAHRPFYARRTEDGPALAAARRLIASRAGLPAEIGSGSLAGGVDRADGRHVAGWARDPAAPETPLLLDVLLDGTPLGQVVANRDRGALGACGFELRWPAPLPADRRHVVGLRCARSGAGLPGAPAVIDALPGLEELRTRLGPVLGAAIGSDAAALDAMTALVLAELDRLHDAEATALRRARQTRFHVSPDARIHASQA